MRVSVRHNDSGFEEFKKIKMGGNEFSVTVDGDRVPMPITADDETGYVEFVVVDGRGFTLMDETGRARTHEMHGKVIIQII